ncbi:MAG: response regulator, partial [Alsobacter sp.]
MADIKSTKVLVVDDQKSMRGLVRFALMQMGMETVDGAESGEEAIKKLTQVRYDLIITDLHMGGISGL